jgi:hypothetical protein
LRTGGRFGRRVEENVIERFLACGDPQQGFARKLVRYAGWYSNRSRGNRRRMDAGPAGITPREVDVREAARVCSTWAPQQARGRPTGAARP